MKHGQAPPPAARTPAPLVIRPRQPVRRTQADRDTRDLTPSRTGSPARPPLQTSPFNTSHLGRHTAHRSRKCFPRRLAAGEERVRLLSPDRTR